MAYIDKTTFDNMQVKNKQIAIQLLTAILAAEDHYKFLLDNQDGETDLQWGRILFQLGDTGQTKLSMDAVANRISAEYPGEAPFASFVPGRKCQINAFPSAGNNITTMVTAKIDNDTIEIGEAVGLVTETGNGDERVRQNPLGAETDRVTANIAFRDVLHEIFQGANGDAALLQVDRLATLRDWIG